MEPEPVETQPEIAVNSIFEQFEEEKGKPEVTAPTILIKSKTSEV